MPPGLEDLSFFTDRGLGARILPTLLREAGWCLTTMDERYGSALSQELDDQDWIADAARRGEVLLCKDLAVAQNELEARAIYMNSARVFALSNARIPMTTGAAYFLANEKRIVRTAVHNNGPYVMAVYERTIARKRLNYQ